MSAHGRSEALMPERGSAQAILVSAQLERAARRFAR